MPTHKKPAIGITQKILTTAHASQIVTTDAQRAPIILSVSRKYRSSKANWLKNNTCQNNKMK